MNPLTDGKSLESGFYGSECKQIAKSNKLKRIHNCHKFNVSGNIKDSEEATKYGLVLIHNWSRSLIDCLLKSTFSNIRNQKHLIKNRLRRI